MTIINSMTSPVLTTPSATPTTGMETSGAISSLQLFELMSSRLSSEGVRHLLNRGCGLGEEDDMLSTLLVDTAALRTQQRCVCERERGNNPVALFPQSFGAQLA